MNESSNRNPPDNATFWICLYVLETAGARFLIYGYATQARGPKAQWRAQPVDEAAGRWKLRRYHRFMTAAEIESWREQLTGSGVRLGTAEGELDVRFGTLTERPRVFAAPRGSDRTWSPQAFSDQLATADCHFCTAKLALLEMIFPPGSWREEEVIDATRRILAKLQLETGIEFASDEAGRLGNFEVIRYLAGDYATTDGLCCVLDAKQSTRQPALLVWSEPPLACDGEMFVNCRLFNGVAPRTLLLDELRTLRLGEAERFAAREPFSECEVSLWKEGQLIAYWRAPSFGASLAISRSVAAIFECKRRGRNGYRRSCAAAPSESTRA